MQEKEDTIALLKNRRERAEAERRADIIRGLGQESQAVVYGILRHKSQDLLGTLYQNVDGKVENQVQDVLAEEMDNSLISIAERAQVALDKISDDNYVLQEVQTTLTHIKQEALQALRLPDNAESQDDSRVNNLRSVLASIEEQAAKTLYLSKVITPTLQPYLDALEDIRRQANLARESTGTTESAEELVDNMRSISTTVRKVIRTGREHLGWSVVIFGSALALLVAFILIISLTLYPEEYAEIYPQLDPILPFNSLLAPLITGLATLLTLLGPPIRVAANWSKRVGELVGEYQEAAEVERERYQVLVESRLAAARAIDEQAVQEALAGQRDIDSANGPNLAAIDLQISDLEAEVEELRSEAGPPGEYNSLIDFVQARQNEQVYEKKLGLMHQVKRDIDVLTGGLVIQPQDNQDLIKAKRELFPRGPARVVLYIDDLDRCPPRRVVEVLEAVQLLLNTELFVVVLGLDTRYITRALEQEYKDILLPDGDPSGLDYIEKIIQLPYRVRPIGNKGMKRFLNAQMQIVDDGEEHVDETNEDSLVVASSDDSQVIPESVIHEEGIWQTAEQNDTDLDVEEEVRETEGDEEDEDDLDELPPEVIRFQPEDLIELNACYQILNLTPRSVKRLVNVLRLLLVYWIRRLGHQYGTEENRPIKRAIIGLLALAAAYPEIMREIFAELAFRYQTDGETMKNTIGERLIEIAKDPKLSFLPKWQIDRFIADIGDLQNVEVKDESGQLVKLSFFNLTLARLNQDNLNLVLSFSFVGDPTYSSSEGGEKSGGPNSNDPAKTSSGI